MEKTQIFIIDVSGSMNSPFNRSKTLRRENQSSTLFSEITHIEAAKQYLATAIINLANQSPATQLIIISFAETSSIVYHGNVSNLNQIKQVINSLQANGGGTNLASAFQLVLNFLSSEKNVTVIRSIDIITDGLANNEGENPEILDYILLKKFAAMFYRDLYCSYCYLDKRFKIALKIVGNDDSGKIEIIDYCNQQLLDTSRKTDVEKDYLFRFRVLVFLIPILFVNILLSLFFFREQPNKNPLPSLPVGSSSKLAEIIESLPEGIMAYSCPNEMTVGITDTCTVRIANNEYLSSFQDALTDRRRKFLEDTLNDGTKKNFERVELNYVSSEMTVKITAKNFKIYPQEEGENQPIIDNDFTSWQWDITPKKSGIQKIKFTASVILEVPGYQKTIPKHYEEQVVEVQVKVNPSYSITSFIENNWQYLTAVFVVSFSCGAFLFIWHKRRHFMNAGNEYNFYNNNIGAAGENASSDNNTFYQSNQQVEDRSLKIEVHNLLDKLAQEKASDSKISQEIETKIKDDVTFKDRLISAFNAGGIEAIKAIFNHPVINVPIEMVKGFIEAEARK